MARLRDGLVARARRTPPAQRLDDSRAAYPAGVNFVVCPYDGTNLKTTEKRPNLSVQVPLRCPACGRRFELDRGNVIEQPPSGTEGSP